MCESYSKTIFPMAALMSLSSCVTWIGSIALPEVANKKLMVAPLEGAVGQGKILEPDAQARVRVGLLWLFTPS